MFSQGREAKLQIRICLELELCVEKAEEILGSLTFFLIIKGCFFFLFYHYIVMFTFEVDCFANFQITYAGTSHFTKNCQYFLMLSGGKLCKVLSC